MAKLTERQKLANWAALQAKQATEPGAAAWYRRMAPKFRAIAVELRKPACRAALNEERKKP